MKIYIPMETRQHVEPLALGSILDQTISCDVVCCFTDGVINTNSNIRNPKDNKAKFEGEGLGRNIALQMAIEADDEFFIMQDRDIVHLKENNFNDAIEMLKKNQKIDAVILPFVDGIQPSHKRIACTVIRTSSIINFKFITDYKNGVCCHCNKFSNEITTEWLGIEKRIYEII